MAIACPITTLQEWQDLVGKVGEKDAYLEWHLRYGVDVMPNSLKDIKPKPSSSRKSVKAELIKKGAVDKYFNIKDLNKFRELNTEYSKMASSKLGREVKLFDENAQGKVAYPMDGYFTEIDKINKSESKKPKSTTKSYLDTTVQETFIQEEKVVTTTTESIVSYKDLMNSKGFITKSLSDSQREVLKKEANNLGYELVENEKGAFYFTLNGNMVNPLGGELFQLNEKSGVPKDTDVALNNKLKSFLRKLGFSVEYLDHIKDSKGNKIEANAKVNFIKRIIEIAEGRERMDTLPEEAAHVLFELAINSPIGQAILKNIDKSKVYEEVVAEYGELYDFDIDRLKREAAGKMLAQAMMEKFNENETPEMQRRQKNWIQRIWDWFKSKLASVNTQDLLKELEVNINKLAEAAIEENLETFERKEMLEEASELYQFIGPRNDAKVKSILDKINQTQKEIVGTVKVGEKNIYKKSDGNTISLRVSDLIEKLKIKLYGVTEPSDNLTHSAVTGTILHSLKDYVMQEVIKVKGNLPTDNKSLNDLKKKAFTEIKKELMQNEEVRDWVKKNPNLNFFDLGITSFKELVEGTVYLHDKIKSIDPDAIILTEVKVYDKTRDVAGTIDVLIIYSDGSVSIADYKSKKLNESRREQFDINQRRMWSAQTNEYLQILKDNYGVTQTKGVFMIPIFVKRATLESKNVSALNSVRVLNKKSKDSDKRSLRYIPTSSSSLGYKDLDAHIDTLRALQDELITKLNSGKNFSETKERLDQLTFLIDSILIDNDITPMFRQLESYFELVNDKSKFDLLSLEELNEVLGTLKMFKGDSNSKYFMSEFTKFIDIKIAQTKDAAEIEKLDNLKTQLAKWNVQTELMLNEVTERIKELAFGEHGVDTNKAQKPRGFFQRFWSGLIDQDNPVFQAFARILRRAKDEAVMLRQEAFREIQEKDLALVEWAKRNGKNIKEVYKLFVTDNKNLINKLSQEFWEDYRKAKKEKDTDWLEKYVKIDSEKLGEKIKNYLDPAKVLDSDLLKQRKEFIAKYVELDPQTGDVLVIKKSIYTQLGQKNIIGNVLSPNTEDSFVKGLEKRYVNENWLEFTKPGNEPLLDYYNMYIQKNQEFYTLTEGRIKRNFIAEIERSFLDNIGEVGLSDLVGKGNFKESFLKQFQIREQDSINGAISTSDGKPVQQVPLLFSDRLRGTLTNSEIKAIEEEVSQKYTKGTEEFISEVDKSRKALEYKKGEDSKSLDLSRSLLYLADSVYNYNALNKIEDTNKALRTVLLMQKQVAVDPKGKNIVNTLSGKVIEMMGATPDLVADFDAFTEMHLYGKKTSKDWILKYNDQSYSGAKVLNFLMQYLAVKALGLNIILVTASFVGSQANRIMMGYEGTFWDRAKANAIDRALLNPRNKDKYKYRAAIDFFEITSKPMVFDQGLKLSKNKLDKTINLRNIFVGHRKGDELADNMILLRMMSNYVIDKADGKLKNPLSTVKKNSIIKDKTSPTIAEAFKFDEKTGIASVEVEGLTAEEIRAAIADFRTIANGVGSRVKGTQTYEQENLFSRNLIGKAFMQFRNWMPGLITTRGAAFGYNESLKEYDYGRFRVTLGELTSSSVTNFTKLLAESLTMGMYDVYGKHGVDTKLAEKYLEEFKKENPDLDITLEEFIELRKRKLQASASELRIYLMLSMLVSLLAMLGFDDDDDDTVEGIIAQNLFLATSRSFLEISFFFNPSSVTDIIKSPLPIWRMTSDIDNLFTNTMDESFDIIFGEDSKNDKTPILHYTSKQIPIVNQFLTLIGHYDRNNVKKPSTVESFIDRL